MRWTAMLLVSLCACDPKDDGLQACDPLVDVADPIELRTIRAIGSDPEGMLYVVDYADGEDDRVFLSQEGELHRAPVLRTVFGDNASGEFHIYQLILGTLQVAIAADASIRMAVAYPPVESFVIGEEGTEFTLLAPDAIAGMHVEDLPGDVLIEYAARTHDDQLLVVTRPTDEPTYEDFRLFFGAPDAANERAIGSLGREEDGGTTTIEFAIDGEPATAYFAVMYGPNGFEHGPWTLTIDGETQDLERLGQVPEPATFRCLPP